MHSRFVGIVFAFSLISSVALAAPRDPCPSNWRGFSDKSGCSFVYVALANVRTGYLKESDDVPFQGNILYYQGLGDSMLNHSRFFKVLTDQGYRVITFDYAGQGGSTGSMNDVTMGRILLFGEYAYGKLARGTATAKKIIIGWSTGGLAAYLAATEKLADAVVLLAPGLVPYKIVGDGLPFLTISPRSLRHTEWFVRGEDTHVDPPRPSSPLKAPMFAAHLLLSARSIRKKSVPVEVKGLALFADSDRFVDSLKSADIVQHKAGHFDTVFIYNGSRHELHSEHPVYSNTVHAIVVEFLNRL